MGLEQVIDEVRRDGDAQAQAILAEAQSEADGIVGEAQKRVDDYRTRRNAAVEREIEQLKIQVASSAEFEARKVVLIKEAQLRGQLRREVLDGFAALPEKVRAAHIKKLVDKAGDIVESGRAWAAKQDVKLLEGQSRYDVAGDAGIRGGIIVESEDGSIRLDLSYETLVDDQWRDILKAEEGLFA